MLIKIIMIVCFFLIMVAVGFYSRKHATNVNDFVLGGRGVGPWLTAFAYGTSYFSAVVFVGYAGQFGWNFGIASTWIGLGNAAIGSLLAWLVLGRRTRIMSNHLKAATMPEFFEKRFNSKAVKVVASVIAFSFLIPYTASVYNGLSYLFEMAFDIPFNVCVIAMAVLTGVYVIMGGYMATAINDFIQGIIMIGGIIAVIGCTIAKRGGFFSALSQLSKVEPAAGEKVVVEGNGLFASFFGPDPLALLSVIILTSLGTWGLPQMVHKFYTIKNEESIKSGTIISTVFAVIVAGGCYFLGGFARLYDCPAIHNASGKVVFDKIIPTIVSGLPDLLVGIVMVLVLSASMSTLSSLVLTSSSTLTLDFLKGAIIKNMKEKTQLMVLRAMIVVFIGLSVVLAIVRPAGIADLMAISWGALAGAFLGPFILGLYWKKTTQASVWASFATGLIITVGNMLAGNIVTGTEAGALAMIGSIIVGFIVSLITPRMKDEEINKIFECYEEKVMVTKKHAVD